MSDFIGPVPFPALDAVAPEIYRGCYGMPMFLIVPTPDLEASKDFWIRGLGFIDLFSVPGQLDHLVDARSHLHRQRSELAERINHLQTMVSSIDRMLEATTSGIQLTPAEQVEIFGATWHLEWIAEAETRWSDTHQWAQYAERTATLTPDDWKQFAAKTTELGSDLPAAMHACIARSYIEDPRYADHYESLAPGMTLWLRDTIFANTEAHGIDPASAVWE